MRKGLWIAIVAVISMLAASSVWADGSGCKNNRKEGGCDLNCEIVEAHPNSNCDAIGGSITSSSSSSNTSLGSMGGINGLPCPGCGNTLVSGMLGPNGDKQHLKFNLRFNSRSKQYDGIFGGLWDQQYGSYLVISETSTTTYAEAVFHKGGGAGISNQKFSNDLSTSSTYSPEFTTLWGAVYGKRLTEVIPASITVSGHSLANVSARAYRLVDQRGNAWYYVDPEEHSYNEEEYNGIAYLYKKQDIYGNVLVFDRVYDSDLTESANDEVYIEPGETTVSRLRGIYEYVAEQTTAARSVTFDLEEFDDSVARAVAVTDIDGNTTEYKYKHDTGLGYWIMAAAIYPDETYGIYDIDKKDLGGGEYRPFWEMCDNRLDEAKTRFYIGEWIDGNWSANGGLMTGKAKYFGSSWVDVLELQEHETLDQTTYVNLLTGEGRTELYDESGNLADNTDSVTGGVTESTYGYNVETNATFADGREYHYHYEDAANSKYALVRLDHEHFSPIKSEYWTYYYVKVDYGDQEMSYGQSYSGDTDKELVVVCLLKTHQDTLGNTTQSIYNFDSDGDGSFNDAGGIDPIDLRLIKKVLPDSNCEQWTYFTSSANDGNKYGLVQTYVSACGKTTEFTYDSNGFISSIELPSSRTISETHNDAGYVTSRTDPANRTWTYAYNEMNKLTETEYPDGSLEQIEYNTCADWADIPTDPSELATWISNKQAADDPIGAAGLVKRKTNRYYPDGVSAPLVAEDPVWMAYTYDAANRLTKIETTKDDDTVVATEDRRYNSTTQQLEEIQTDSTFILYVYAQGGQSNTLPLIRKTCRLVSGTPGSSGSQLSSGTWQITENAFEYEDTAQNPRPKTRRVWYSDTFYRRSGMDDTLKSRTEYAYTAAGQTSSRQTYAFNGSAGSVLAKVAYTYDSKDNMVTQTVYDEDTTACTTTYRYDIRGRMDRITNPDSSYKTLYFDADGNQTRETNEEGQDFSWTYDDDGRPSTFTADVSGNNDIDQEWTYTDDTTNRRYITTHTNKTRDSDSYVKKYEGCCGRIYKVERTSDGIGSDLLTDYTCFTGDGQLRRAIEASGKVLTTEYDELDRITAKKVWDDGETISITTDTFTYEWAADMSQTVGWRVTRTDAASREWVMEYDGVGRLVKKTDPADEDTVYTHDAMPSGGDTLDPADTYVSSVTDPEDRVDHTYMDMARRTVRKVEDWGTGTLNSVTDSGYDTRGLLLQLTAYTSSNPSLSGAQKTRYEYNSRGQLVTETLGYDSSNPDLSHDKITWYYPDGELKATLEQRIESTTDQWIGVLNTRDQRNRILYRYFYSFTSAPTGDPSNWGTPDCTDSFDYNDAYDTVTATGGMYDTWVYTKFNDVGQVLEERQAHSDDITRYINYSYIQGGSKAGELKCVYFPSDSSNNRIQWQYDSYHRPSNLYRKTSGTELLVGQWTWNDDGTKLWFRRGNDIDTTLEYSTIGLVSRSRTVDGNSNTIFDQHYEYDKVGNRITQKIDEETNWDERYYYDGLYRLTEMKRGNVWLNNDEWVVSSVQRTEDWGLDLLYNWTGYDVSGDETISQDRTHNVLNQITDIDQTSLVYDLQGNMTDDGNRTYVWDLAGKLKEVKDDQDATIATFAYDAYGRRVTKDDGTNVYHYYYNGWQVIEEYMDNGVTTALMARNVWGLYLDELVVRTDVNAGSDLYPVSNSVYSPLRYYDGSGNLTARIKYTPYGKAALVDSNGTAVIPTEANYPILFTGQRHDRETGLDYFKARMWSQQAGRFVSRDPKETFQVNCYSGLFVPISMDSFGLMPIPSSSPVDPNSGVAPEAGGVPQDPIYSGRGLMNAVYQGLVDAAEDALSRIPEDETKSTRPYGLVYDPTPTGTYVDESWPIENGMPVSGAPTGLFGYLCVLLGLLNIL
ncbi:MAG: RHS repeat-associated core domain-containing protein [Planctomycetota bacterium]